MSGLESVICFVPIVSQSFGVTPSQRMKKRMIGYDYLDGRIRGLVYQKSLPPRAPLAGLTTIGRAVGGPETESPRSAACSAEFRTQVRPQPSFTAPLVRPPPEHSAVTATDASRGGSYGN
jgi:hypothetical protein